MYSMRYSPNTKALLGNPSIAPGALARGTSWQLLRSSDLRALNPSGTQCASLVVPLFLRMLLPGEISRVVF